MPIFSVFSAQSLIFPLWKQPVISRHITQYPKSNCSNRRQNYKNVLKLRHFYPALPNIANPISYPKTSGKRKQNHYQQIAANRPLKIKLNQRHAHSCDSAAGTEFPRKRIKQARDSPASQPYKKIISKTGKQHKCRFFQRVVQPGRLHFIQFQIPHTPYKKYGANAPYF